MTICAPLKLAGGSYTSSLQVPLLNALYIDLYFYNTTDNRVRKGVTRDHKDGAEEVSVGRDRRRGHQRGRCHEMRGRGTLAQMEDRQVAARRTQSSISDPYGKESFLQSSQEADVSF